MLLGGLWHGANWTFVVWGGVHGLMLAVNHAWNAVPLSRHPRLKGAAARRIAILVTFIAVTLAWVPFRAETLTEARLMLSYLWPATDDPNGLESLQRFLRVQFLDLKGFFAITGWLRPRELWPPILPPDYLATAIRPVGPFLLWIGIATFIMPNTYQIFARFQPALGLPEDAAANGVLGMLDRRVAVVVAGMFLLSVLRLSHVSPFLYYQF